MAYFTREQLEAFSGEGFSSFKADNTTMEQNQWDDLVTTVIEPQIAQVIHRYCGVISFEETPVEDYFNGKGASDEDGQYLETDRRFYLRYQPVIEVEEVSEDVNAPTMVPSWTERIERSDSDAGDFVVAEDEFYEFTYLRFHNNVPRLGHKNLYVRYYAGYTEGSEQLNEISHIALRLATNFILLKKKVQESSTLRNMGVRDYSQFFNIHDADIGDIMTPEIKEALERYKRWNTGGMLWQ